MIVLLDLLVIALITAVFWSGPLLARPTLPFGVRVPAEHAADPEILAHRRRHGHRVTAIGAVAALTLLGVWLWTGWAPGPGLTLLPILAAGVLCGLLAARGVHKTKQDKNFDAGTRRASATDLGLRTNPVRLPWPLLAPALLFAGATAVTGILRYGSLPPALPVLDGLGADAARSAATTVSAAFAPVTAQVLLIALAILVTAGILRARPEVEPDRPAGSARRYRVYLRGISRLMALSAGAANATLLVLALQLWGLLGLSRWITGLSFLPLIVALGGWVWFAVRVGEAGHRLPAEPGEERESAPVRRDDDRYWHLAGMVYVNRGDPAVLVHRRAGMFWTLNLGNPRAWAVIAAIATVMLTLGGLDSLDVINLPWRD